MAWNKAGSTTLASAGDDMDITSMTASNFNQLLWHKISSGSCVGQMTFNNNSNSVYARRRSINGGGELTDASQAFIKTDISDVDDSFIVWNVCSFSGNEKLIMSIQCNRGSAGAGNAPNRVELVGKFVPSPDANITRIDINNPNGGSFDTNSNLSVLGSDGVESMTVQDGAVYYETDTNKSYVLYDDSWSEL